MNTERVGFVEGDGLRLRVVESGDPGRPTVLLVHGYPDDSSVWDGVVPLLSDRFHVVRYDVRGAGGSEAPSDRSGYLLDHLARDLAAVARAVSPDAPVHLVGHDWGSIQSWHAVTDPDVAPLFASYTTISGPCLDHLGHWLRRSAARLRLRPLLRQLARSWYIGFFQLPVVPELVWSLPPLRAAFHATARNARNGIQLYRANMLAAGGSPGVRRTDVPVQQLALTEDAFVLPDLLAAADPWCSSLWRRELRAAHWAPRSDPDAVASAVEEFVGHVSGAPASRALRAARVGRDGPAGGFAGRLVLVTGAGSGIGRATSLAFAAAGADVLAVDIDEAGAAATASRAAGHGVASASYRADVSDGAAMRALAARVTAEHGVPDIVMANAGVAVAGPFLRTDEADWRHVLDVNLWGVVHTLRAFAPGLVERGTGGHLVVTASAAAFTPWPVLSAYATTKAAVLSLAQSLRTELAPHDIGVTAVCPGIVATNIVNSARFAGQDPDTERRSRGTTDALYRRHYGPDRVATAVLRAVRANRAVQPVTPEAYLAAWGSRLSPGVMRGMGRWFRSPS